MQLGDNSNRKQMKTERESAEKTLRESEEKYRKLFEEALDAIFIADAETGVLVDCNRAACELVGREKSELVGKHQRVLHPPQEIEGGFSKTFKQHLKEKEGQVLETQVITKNGEAREVAIKANVFEVKGRKLIQGIFRDITEHKKTEEELRENEGKFRAIAAAAEDAIILADDEGRIIYWNPAAERIFGYSKEEAAGKELHKLILPKRFHIGYKSGLANFKLTGEGVVVGRTFEGVAVRKDGTEIPVELSMSAFQMEDKWHAVTIIRDITERKRAEEQIKKVRDDYLAITNLTGDIIVHVDKEGRWTFLNDQACKFWGKPRDELLDVEFADYLHPDDREKTNAAIQEAIRTRKIIRGFINKQKTPKGWRTVEWNCTPIFDEKGNYVGLQATGRDITERRRLEEELKRYSEHLERLVEERTRELRKAERLAAIGETAAMIGHDLRNPLQVIVNTLYLTNKKLKSMPVKDRKIMEKYNFLELKRTLLEQVEYMNKIVSELQDYASPLKPKLAPTSLHELINGVLLTLKVPDNVEVYVLIPENFPKLMLDPAMMKRVFTNLFTNALQAMPDGGRLTIKAGKTVETAFISVEDTGVGIPEENLDKIFTPLFTTKPKGQGFGLPICKRVVEAHGGSITAESQVGRGSTFTVKIPLRRR